MMLRRHTRRPVAGEPVVLLGGRMKQPVSFNPDRYISITIGIGRSKPNSKLACNRKGIESSSYVWLLMNCWALEPIYA